MKRFLTCLMTLCALTGLAVSAQADILWAPRDNSFYDRHSNELTYVGRQFLANGPEGYITVWNAPGGNTVVSQYENGAALWVYYAYQDWGLIGDWGGDLTEGWIPLADLSLIYDHISFEEEYVSQIRDYKGEFAGYSGELTCVNFYEYPGAPEVKLPYEPVSAYREEIKNILTGKDQDWGEAISKVFTDEEGRAWGYVDYLYRRVEGWFCLDNPDGADFPIRQVPDTEFTAPQAPVRPASFYVPYILVGGVVAVTAGLLFWFYARKRGEGNNG